MFQPKRAHSSRVYEHGGTFYGLCGDPAGSRLYAGSTDGTIYVYDVASEQQPPAAHWQEKHENYVVSLAYVRRPLGENVISGSYDGSLIWWDAPSGGVIRRIAAHEGWVRQVVVTPDGAQTISVGDDMLVKVWDTDSRESIHALRGHAAQTPQGYVSALYAVAVSADGRYAASGDRAGEVRVWELGNGRELARFQVPELYTFDNRARKRSIGGIRSLAFAPDGRHIAVGGIGQVGNVDGLEAPAHLEVWAWPIPDEPGEDPAEPRRVFATETSGHKSILNALAFDSSGHWLCGAGGGGDNGILAFWNVAAALSSSSGQTPEDQAADKSDGKESEGKESKPPEVPIHKHKFDGHAHAMVWREDQNRLYAAGFGKLEVWDLGPAPPGAG